MMKSVSVSVCKLILVATVLVFVFMPLGCSSLSQPGQTAAEGSRKHHRIARLNQQEMMSDIDAVLMLDEPSRLSDQRIP
jgi:hypothetical protein